MTDRAFPVSLNLELSFFNAKSSKSFHLPPILCCLCERDVPLRGHLMSPGGEHNKKNAIHCNFPCKCTNESCQCAWTEKSVTTDPSFGATFFLWYYTQPDSEIIC